jgi:hypothetical protein
MGPDSIPDRRSCFPCKAAVLSQSASGTRLVPTATSDVSRTSTDVHVKDAVDAPGRIYTNCLSAGGRKVASSNQVTPIKETPLNRRSRSPDWEVSQDAGPDGYWRRASRHGCGGFYLCLRVAAEDSKPGPGPNGGGVRASDCPAGGVGPCATCGNTAYQARRMPVRARSGSSAHFDSKLRPVQSGLKLFESGRIRPRALTGHRRDQHSVVNDPGQSFVGDLS